MGELIFWFLSGLLAELLLPLLEPLVLDDELAALFLSALLLTASLSQEQYIS